VAKKSSSATAVLDASTRIAVLVGAEHFLLTENTAQLKERLTEELGEVETIHFDGATAPLAEVLDECRTVGLLQQHKMVVVDAADQFVKEGNRALMERYAEHPSASATLVLRCGKWNAGKLDKLIEKVGLIKKCESVSEEKARAWAAARVVKRYGTSIEPEAAELLVERLGADLGRIDTELAKLAVSGGREGGKAAPITREAVAELVGVTREEEAWDVQATVLVALREGNPEAALKQLRLTLENSRESPVFLSFVMMDLARKLHLVGRGIQAGGRPFDVARQLRLWGKAVEAMLEAAKHVTPERAAAMLRLAVACDVKQKSGVGEGDRILESEVVEMVRGR
jgi:DNA polymerase-3 subunit delta